MVNSYNTVQPLALAGARGEHHRGQERLHQEAGGLATAVPTPPVMSGTALVAALFFGSSACTSHWFFCYGIKTKRTRKKC